MHDQAFRFILEEPNNSKGQARKRARLVTACDACRMKKIKCIRSPDAPDCEACAQSATFCEYADRDRYQAERGLTYPSQRPSTSSSVTQTQEEPELPKRKRPRHQSISSSVPNTTPAPEPSPLIHPSSSGTAGPSFSSRIPTSNEPQPDPSSPITTAQPAGPLKRITVPFFRYFGPTANTPGYRRVNVRTLTLPDDSASRTSRSPGPSTLSGSVSSSMKRQESLSPGMAPTMLSSTDSLMSAPLTEVSGSSATSTMVSTDPESSFTAQFDMLGRTPHAEPASPRTIAYNQLNLHGAPQDGNNAPESPAAALFFDPLRPRYPNPVYLTHLATLFFDHLACHFPFLDREDVLERVQDKSLPAVLANCIGALAVRFSDREELLIGERHAAGEPYCDMAKLLIVHMLSWPSLEVLQALVLIAWSEFGSGRDSGLWMYSRMAVGMAMDLGLGFEATVMLAATPDEQEKVRLTWWSVVLIDHINSWGTGRPIAVTDNQFDTALPCYEFGEDMFLPPPQGFVYGYLCRLVQLRGKMGDVLNNLVKRKVSEYPVDMELSELQSQMTSYYQSLPPSLVFTIQNFRRYSTYNQAAVFLLLHVIFHSVITVLQRPSLLRSFTPDVALPLANNVDLSRSSARSIIDMVMLATEVDQEAVLANPFLDLPILTAGRAFLAEREIISKPPPNATPVMIMLMLQWGETSLERCKEALTKMSKFWGGVGCVKMILDQQSDGHLDFDIGEGITPDSRIANLRDVELITQWATKAWRRHVRRGNGHELNGSGPSGLLTSSTPTATSAVPLLPVDHNSAQYGSASGAPQQQHQQQQAESFGDSPDGAAIGITGYLDGPLLLGTPPPDGYMMDDLRVSFNSAEADLSFANFSTELFNVPEGFEDFLASHVNGDGGFLIGGPEGGEYSGQGHMDGQAGDSSDHTVGNGTGYRSWGHSGDMIFPAFSSLGLPMQRVSRASSPSLR